MAQVQRTKPADADLLEIWAYIAESSIESADKVLHGIAQKCWNCAEMPGMGRRRDELAPGLQSVVYERYVIFYLAIEDGIQLVRVLHGARDLPTVFNLNDRPA